MDWMLLITTFLPIILECINTEGEEAVVKRLRACGPRVVWKLRQGVRDQGVDQGLRGRALRKFIRDGVAEGKENIKSASKAELLGVCASARELEDED